MTRKLTVYTSDEKTKYLLTKFIIAKGQEAEHQNYEDDGCKVQDGDLTITNITDIFQYLEDRYPAPHLLPWEPEAKAVAKELIKQITETYTDRYTQQISTLRSLKPTIEHGGFIADRLSAIDLAVLPIIDNSRDRLWHEYKERVLSALE